MRAISALWKRDFATIRQLESNSYRLMRPLAVLLGVGIIFCFTTLLLAVGIALIGLSAFVMMGLFAWVIHLQKTPRREVRCPYCNNPNSVFTEVTDFDCDICDRPIKFNEVGAPMPADGSLDNTQPTSVWDG